MIERRQGRVSWQAELARLGLRLLRLRSHHETIEDARRTFRRMEAIIPKPPRSIKASSIDIEGIRADCIVAPSSRADRHLLFLHGGAYRIGAPSTYRHFTWRLTMAARARLLAIDYRLAPEHPFPAALDDAALSYRWLLDRGADPRGIAVVGDSAGGGLTLALLLKLRDGGMPLPAAAVAMSPWTDLALTGASLVSNAKADPMLNADDVPRFAAEYLAGTDPHNPYASPLYGDPAGLPPTLLQVGSDEILLDDAVRMAERMRRANCEVRLEVWPRMPHVWQLLAPFVPEARKAIAGIGTFLRQHGF